MIYNAEIAYDGTSYNTKWQIGRNTNDGWVDCFGYYLDYEHENYEIMQCTGMKDKNDKLIYEGDIVKQNNTIYSVNWFNGSFCFKDTLNGKNYTVEFVMSEKQEVIGNIYENPDLI